MTKLIHLHHMTGETVTPRHFNALVDVVNAMADVIEAQTREIDLLNVAVSDMIVDE